MVTGQMIEWREGGNSNFVVRDRRRMLAWRYLASASVDENYASRGWSDSVPLFCPSN